MTEVTVQIHALTIRDENSGEEHTVWTTRSIQEVAEEVQEREREYVGEAVSSAVYEKLEECLMQE